MASKDITGVPRKRVLEDWITNFVEYTNGIPSPLIFRQWAGLAAVAGVLERRCWTDIYGNHLYPNNITFLVGEPGTGKSFAIKEVHDMWVHAGHFNIAPAGMTKAALIDQMMALRKTYEWDGMPRGYNACLIAAEELGTLIPENDMRFLNVVNDIYDCNEVFEDRVRSRREIDHVDRPHIHIIGGTTPGYLGQTFPDAAYTQGFMSRVVMVYSGARIVTALFNKRTRPAALRKDLIKDLGAVAHLVGDFTWSNEAADLVEAWNLSMEGDAPTHDRLLHYGKRRVIHVLKMSMALSASESNDMKVTMEHYKKAKAMLLEAEGLMPDIFKSMQTSPDAAILQEIHLWCFAKTIKIGAPSVTERELNRCISLKTPVHRVQYFIDMLIKTGMIKEVAAGAPGHRKFAPEQLGE